MDKNFPPCETFATLSLSFVVIGGITMAAYSPDTAPFTLSGTLLGIALLVFVINAFLIAKVFHEIKSVFIKVAKWMILVEVIVSGLLFYVFYLDGTRSTSLVILTAFLALFALNIPIIVGYTVAKSQLDNNFARVPTKAE